MFHHEKHMNCVFVVHYLQSLFFRSPSSENAREKKMTTHVHCQKLGTRWCLRVRTKAIMAANSYKKCMEIRKLVQLYRSRAYGSSLHDSKHVKCCVTLASGLKMAN